MLPVATYNKCIYNNLMESVWWVFKQLFNKELVYQGHKVMLFSIIFSTLLSNLEAGLSYKDVRDPVVVVEFLLIHNQTTPFIDWTTNPWILPSNTALCVHDTMEYVKIQDIKSNKLFILAKSRISQLYTIINNKKSGSLT